VTDVQTVKHNGIVTNYYDPGRRRLYLHGDILSGKTLSCWALALHEAAHALQKGEDGDSFQWRRTCIRLTRYVPMLAVFGTAALMFFMKIPFRNSMMIFIAICVLIMLMNLGTLVTIGAVAPKNFTHIVARNETYEANGGHPIPGRTAHFAGLAREAGIAKSYRIDTLDAFEALIPALLHEDGPIFVELIIAQGVLSPRSYKDMYRKERRVAFRQALQES
jgi:hypothetical protein